MLLPTEIRSAMGRWARMSSVSIWQDTSAWPALEQRDLECDVCVVGAGVVGSSLATFLSRAGKSVVVLEPAAAREPNTSDAHEVRRHGDERRRTPSEPRHLASIAEEERYRR